MSSSMDLSSDQPGESQQQQTSSSSSHQQPSSSLSSSSSSPSSSSSSPSSSHHQHQHPSPGGSRLSLHVQVPPSSSSLSFTPNISLPPRDVFPTNRFKKVRTIRKTLMGKVVLFQDLLTNKLVAIKVSDKQLLLSGKTSTGNAVAENPLEEIKTMNILAGTIQKPGIDRRIVGMSGQEFVLTSLGEYEDEKNLFTVMEFCGKGEFFDIVCNETRFSELKGRKYFIEMMLGVRYLHAFGICHLDLSLENLLMTENDTLKICDYGVARHVMYDPNTHQEISYPPAASNKPGKLGYMSPSIFGGEPFSGYLSDVYSCGVILFISLLGVPPYQYPAASDQRFALIHSGNIYRLLQAWNMTNLLSPLAVDLLSKMLAPEKNRISVQEIFNHPWVSGVAQDNNQNNNENNYNNNEQTPTSQSQSSSNDHSMSPSSSSSSSSPSSSSSSSGSSVFSGGSGGEQKDKDDDVQMGS